MGEQAVGSKWKVDKVIYTISKVEKKDGGGKSVHISGDNGEDRCVDEITFASWVASGKAQVIDAATAIVDGLKDLGIEKQVEASPIAAATTATKAPPTTNYTTCKWCGGDLKKKKVPGNEYRWICYGKGHGGGCGGAFSEDELKKK